MNKKDFRIGNLLYNPFMFCTHEVSETTLSGAEITRYDPIPLTEKWLVKFGFIKELSNSEDYFNFILNDDYRVYEHNGDWKISLVFLGGYDGDITEPSSFYFVKQLSFVHQLQNLYFALTGEELKIK